MPIGHFFAAAAPYALFDPRRLPPLDRAAVDAVVREQLSARSARLALDHLLTRNGRTLQVAEPIFCLSRAPDDHRGLAALMFVLERTSGVNED